MLRRMVLVDRLLRQQLMLTGGVPRGGATGTALQSLHELLGFELPRELSDFLSLQDGIGSEEGIAGTSSIATLLPHLKSRSVDSRWLCPLQYNSILDEISAVDVRTNTMISVPSTEPARAGMPLWEFLAIGAGLTDMADSEAPPVGSPQRRARAAWEIARCWAELLPDLEMRFGPPTSERYFDAWDRALPEVLKEMYKASSSLSFVLNGTRTYALLPPDQFILGERAYAVHVDARSRRTRAIGSQAEPAEWWSKDWLAVRSSDADFWCADCASAHGRVLQVFHDEVDVPVVAQDLADFLGFTPWLQFIKPTGPGSDPIPG